MKRSYSVKELRALIEIERLYGGVKYANPYDLEREFYKRTGSSRASGPLYMAHWRIKKGYYDHILWT